MARSTDDDILEPILPKHPPVAGEPGPPVEEAATVGPDAPRVGTTWHRTVLVVCAVVATLALVFSAVQLSSIAEDQRLQACQVRVYAEETLADGRSSGQPGRLDLRERFAECLGVEVDDDADRGSGDD